MQRYDAQNIEQKWQREWERVGTFRQYRRPKKQYVLDMFPYPSGAGLHVGHPKGYIASDVFARFKQLQGYGVLHPMGWDAFGLPAEQYAIKNNVHPEAAVKKNIATFKSQLRKMGFTYDWDREINTTDPEYYRWTQWIFLQMWKKGLAYESYEPINWCPSCQTGLANEDLEGGRCERCDAVVEKRPMRQWMLRITKYADTLLRDLRLLEWPEGVKEAQRNWIGRSEGAAVRFKIADLGLKNESTINYIEVFTTRLDTIYGCTYVVVAPEHEMIANCTSQLGNGEEVESYVAQTKKKTELERTELAKTKTGVKLDGVSAVNPFTSEAVPIYVADYVLGNYGTGAVMAVPAHDPRDFAFAVKYGLPVKAVVRPSGVDNQTAKNRNEIDSAVLKTTDEVYVSDGILIHSGEFTGLSSAEARKRMMKWLTKKKRGGKKVSYKLRDWVFSRQRYWGEPIPLIHCERCGVVPVPEKDLPVRLPRVKAYQPTGTGESPLADIAKWVRVKCPRCGNFGKRETNTMPQWAGSSWYYLRYIDPHNKRALIAKRKEKKLMPVDVYVGGDHATRHLIYARFWHKFLYDQGVVSTPEPFRRLEFLGLILAADGRKMSKRWGNIVSPDEVIAEVGADAFRTYEMFMGPFDQSIAWNMTGAVGARRFLEKVWRLQANVTNDRRQGANDEHIETLLHKTVRKVTEDIEHFRFNTAVSALMILVNALEKEPAVAVSRFQVLLLLLAPFAPHITEELWQRIGEKKSIFLAAWPRWDKRKINEETVTIVVQVNGKLRDRLILPAAVSTTGLREAALKSPKVQALLSGKAIRSVIVVPGKVVNIVTAQ